MAQALFTKDTERSMYFPPYEPLPRAMHYIGAPAPSPGGCGRKVIFLTA
jgi:hypothetical protein